MSKLNELKARVAAARISLSAQVVQVQVQVQAPSPPAKSALQLPTGTDLFDKVSALQEALLSRHPMMPGLLRDIHTTLRSQPENVTLLSEAQISVIVNGLKVQTGIVFAAAATSTGAKGIKARIAKMGLEAI